MEKKILRKNLLQIRDNMTDSMRRLKDEAIFQKVKNHPKYKGSAHIFIYVGFGSEIDTLSLIKDALADGKRVSVPFVFPKEKRMVASEIRDPQKDLIPGYQGIQEVRPDRLKITPPDALDLIIMPGVGFDPAGHRLGYGGGYYDRFLETCPEQVYLLALCYREMLISHVPTESHDRKVDEILTD